MCSEKKKYATWIVFVQHVFPSDFKDFIEFGRVEREEHLLVAVIISQLVSAAIVVMEKFSVVLESAARIMRLVA